MWQREVDCFRERVILHRLGGNQQRTRVPWAAPRFPAQNRIARNLRRMAGTHQDECRARFDACRKPLYQCNQDLKDCLFGPKIAKSSEPRPFVPVLIPPPLPSLASIGIAPSPDPQPIAFGLPTLPEPPSAFATTPFIARTTFSAAPSVMRTESILGAEAYVGSRPTSGGHARRRNRR
jgi:hypothetical protein